MKTKITLLFLLAAFAVMGQMMYPKSTVAITATPMTNVQFYMTYTATNIIDHTNADDTEEIMGTNIYTIIYRPKPDIDTNGYMRFTNPIAVPIYKSIEGCSSADHPE